MPVKVLYVEDNEDNVYLLTRRLSRKGFDVLVAKDGQEAVAVAQAERPALILMDLDLPVLDGWEATRQLKSMTEMQATPIIALTSHAMAGDREKALAAGCDDYETKPIDFSRLLAKMTALLPAGGTDER